MSVTGAAFIVTIGDELTKGEILDSNASYIAERLTAKGVAVSAVLTLPDDYRISARLIRRVLKDPGIYVFTGGLGGTRDDITRRIIGKVLKKTLRVDEGKAGALKEWYTSRKRPFRRADLMQASAPEGGTLLANPVGLAYGFYIEDGGREVFSLPGVPREMKAMFEQEVLPKLEGGGFFADRTRETLTFACISEYTLDREIEKIVGDFEGVHYGTRSGCDIVKVVFESEQGGIEACVSEVEKRLGRYFVARGSRPFEQVVGDLLARKGRTLSTAESCTAGFLSKVITDVPGSSGYYLGGVVAYSNAAKRGLLGLDERTLEQHGAVSGQTAEAMAKGALERFSSDIAVGITGIAGPEGGSAEKPVGTVFICVCGRGGEPVMEKNVFLGDREMIRLRAVNRALFMLLRFAERI
jgi:nicotinamide-nucleotide amidase